MAVALHGPASGRYSSTSFAAVLPRGEVKQLPDALPPLPGPKNLLHGIKNSIFNFKEKKSNQKWYKLLQINKTSQA